MKRFIPLALVLIILTMSSIPAAAHCQIPCGIYNDTMRVAMMYEHIVTIEKSMKLISDLGQNRRRRYQSNRALGQQ